MVLAEDNPFADALMAGWATLIRDNDQHDPVVEDGWKTYKIALGSPIEMIPIPDGVPIPAVLNRTAYITYDPERWVWAGAQETDTCAYRAAGHSYHLARRA